MVGLSQGEQGLVLRLPAERRTAHLQPDGGEGLAKHKGVIARWRLKEVWSKAAT
jgi:hypothetical protein